MGTKRDVEIGILLDEAQRAHRCLAAHDRKLKAALDRRTPNQLVCPRSHLYARKGYWDGLGHRQREEHILRAEATLRPGLSSSATQALRCCTGCPYRFDALRASTCCQANAGRRHAARAASHVTGAPRQPDQWWSGSTAFSSPRLRTP